MRDHFAQFSCGAHGLGVYIDTCSSCEYNRGVADGYDDGAKERDHAQADAEALADVIREHIRNNDDGAVIPLLVGHSVGCMITQQPTSKNSHTTGYRCVADCADQHRALANVLAAYTGVS